MISLNIAALLAVVAIAIMTDNISVVSASPEATPEPQKEKNTVSYGLDISFPMLQNTVSTNYPWLPHNVDPENYPTPEEFKHVGPQVLGNRQTFYEDYIQGCRDYWTAQDHPDACDEVEQGRLEHIANQAHSMVNYTDVGYKKIKAPEHVYKMLLEFWEKNQDKEQNEEWFEGNVFVNYWDQPSKMVDVQNSDLEGGGNDLLQEVWDSSVNTISEWTGMKLVPSSLYGIRVYKENAVLMSHVDRLPLISSAIINVAQDVDEPWPLEVIGHDGIATNVTMEPGDMVLYESHSVVHGRPFPLKGRYFANVFIHFEPDPDLTQENGQDLPAYIQEGSIEAQKFRDGEYEGDIPSPNAKALQEKRQPPDEKKTIFHEAAGDGDLDILVDEYLKDSHSLHEPDSNGWQPIHEAARGGHMEIIEFLVENGADINARTHDGEGYSVLSVISDFWGMEDPLFEYLYGLGAFEAGPEL